jgi:hypothetical protein
MWKWWQGENILVPAENRSPSFQTVGNHFTKYDDAFIEYHANSVSRSRSITWSVLFDAETFSLTQDIIRLHMMVGLSEESHVFEDSLKVCDMVDSL